MNYLVVTIKSWNIKNFKKLKQEDKKNKWFLITDKKDFNYNKIKKINPRYIFIPHWSWMIPEDIWSNFECIVFHMTDLPYGRGGSPLQNLIWRGHKKTKITALRVGAGFDTGDIYMKKELNLKGSATEIFERASQIVFNKIIPDIIKNNLKPKPQLGKITYFKRRKPEQSKITDNLNLGEIYDLIRMLDGEGYPLAFMENKKLKFDFFEVKKENNKLTAKVKIYEK